MKLFILICGLFISCHGPKKVTNGNQVISQVLEQTKEYSIVRFKGYKTMFQISSDTLKVNDTIRFNVVKIYRRKK